MAVAFPFTESSCGSPAFLTAVSEIDRVTSDERHALLLAARLLENGVVVDEADPLDDGGHVNIALVLAGRLARVVDGPDEARELVASLRSAAAEPAEA